MKFAAAIVLLFALASVASARPVSLRSLTYHHWENDHVENDHGEEEHDPIYCTGVEHSKDECPEHYECAALEDKVCEDCVKDDYGNDKCTHKEPCWEYACIEIPKYCNVTYGKDECVTKYGEEEDLKCKKLEKEECVYEKECKHVDTDECAKYEYEDKCTYVDVCVEYKQEKKCEPNQKVCKTYKQEKVCKHAQDRCVRYHNGKCTDYAPSSDDDCEYVDTDVCKEYETIKGECEYVDVCKRFKEEKECEKVKKGCLVYEQEEVCDDVEVCWTGKCVKEEAPKKEAPKKHAPKKAGYTFGK